MAQGRWQATIQDDEGNVVPGASVEVRLEATGNLATLFSDRAGTTPKANPFTADGDGYAFFHAAGGAYKIVASFGADSMTHRYVPVGIAGESDSTSQFSESEVTASGNVTLTSGAEDQVSINKTSGAATRVILPLASTRALLTPIRIVDKKGDAATNNITIVPKRPTTFTMTIASPSVFTSVAHGLVVDGPVSLETTGALPTNFAPDTQYYVKTVPTADTFTLAATKGGAAINGTGSQSGTHTYGTDTIMGGAAFVIDSNGASIQLRPYADGTGWS